jgi:hypothetical protein
MSTAIVNTSNPNSNYLNNSSISISSNIKTVLPQMAVAGAMAATIHAGLSWSGFGSEFKGTPLASALFFGLAPAVHQATLAFFKSGIQTNPSENQESKQVKAQLSIASVSAAFCTPICNTLIYNLFAKALDLAQWDVSTVFHHQINYTLYYPALIAGMTMMTNTVIKTLLIAEGVSEEEIELKMKQAQSRFAAQDPFNALSNAGVNNGK